MRSALLTFQDEIRRLRTFLSAASAEEQLYPAIKEVMGAVGDIHSRSIDIILNSVISKRRYNYFVTIIVLYGALERYIEDVIKIYISLISDLAKQYDKLPSSIRNRHLDLTVEYLWLIKESRVRVTEEPENIIRRLSGCINGDSKFEIDARAFTLRAGNVNQERVKRILMDLGIELTPRRLSKTKSYRVNYAKIGTAPVNELGDEEVRRLFREVDELVETRNLIAHGVSNIDQIEERGLIEARIESTEVYVKAVQDVMEQEMLRFCIDTGCAKQLGPVVDVFNHSIVCLEHGQGDINVGDLVLMVTQDKMEPLRYGRISTIEIDHERLETVCGSPGLKIGIKVDMRAMQNGNYYLLAVDLHQAILA